MEAVGNLSKMKVIQAEPVQYSLELSGQKILMNQLLGRQLHIAFQHEINCIHCGRKTSKSFGQGFCYPCFTSAPEASECVLRPELCQAQLGISRDMSWSQEHCLQDHFVYLALTSAIKVGVTRHSQVPTRWIDQGAWKALKIAKTPNRYIAGLIEVELKKHLPDKTNWRHMLTNQMDLKRNLIEEKQRVLSLLPESLSIYKLDENTETELVYPVLEYPSKVNSLSLDKNPVIEGTLTGIRGQYLYLGSDRVVNIRNHSGYKVLFRV